MDKEQMKKEFKSYLESTELSKTEKIDETKYSQEEFDDSNDILNIDSDRRIQILEAAKKQLKDDKILYPYIMEENNLDLDKNETVKR